MCFGEHSHVGDSDLVAHQQPERGNEQPAYLGGGHVRTGNVHPEVGDLEMTAVGEGHASVELRPELVLGHEYSIACTRRHCQ